MISLSINLRLFIHNSSSKHTRNTTAQERDWVGHGAGVDVFL